MDTNAIQIAVRVRPWHPEKELPFVQRQITQPFFHGDGNFSVSPQKPVAQGALREVVEVIDGRELDFDKPQEEGGGVKRGAPSVGRRYKNRKYVFDQVFAKEASQEDVFEKTAKSLLPGVLDGYNATVFAYGATGCGKTHTISGTEEDPGIIIRTMRELFDLVEDTKLQYDTFFEMSMVEIYNEMIRDLLSDDYPACPPGGLKLLENEKERVKVDKVTLRQPTSVDEVMSLVMLGNERRSTSFTARNSVSSRSHLVLQINVGRNERGSEVDVTNSKVRQHSTSATLSIIDLAGSEKASVNRGQRMKEGANINKSLLALSSCISALCQRPLRGVRPHVPYRDSKLTRLLKFSLGGNCRTVMINCVSPSSRDIEETNNTLLWADKAKKVSTKVSRNTAGVELRTAQWIQKIVTLEATIKSLEQQLASGQNARSGLQKRRLEKARRDAQEELETIQGDVDSLLPVILEGSEMDALWNASVLQVEALETRLQDINVEIASGRSEVDAQREKDHLRSLIQQQDEAYRFNDEIETGIKTKNMKHITLQNSLRKAEERNFDDDLAEAKYQHLLKVADHKAHVARSVAAAKERGLRDYIAQQADTLTKAASLLSRFSTLLNHEIITMSSTSATDDVTALVHRLRSLGTTVDSSVASLFGEVPSPLSVGSARIPFSLAAPSPRRPSVRTGASPKRFAHRVSPKKIPPARPSLFANAIANQASAPEGSKGKVFRWPDETGEGKIDDRSIAPDAPIFSSPSTDEVSAAPDSSSSDWEDVKPSASMIPAALRPLPVSAAPMAPSVPVVPISTATADVPAWKQMRMARGLVTQLFETVAEESSPSSKSSTSGPSRSSSAGLMGPPARVTRPGPLAELHSVPSAQPSLSHSTSTSNLLKPTAASAARAITPPASSSFASVKINMSSLQSTAMLPPAMKPTRRESMIGPARHDRPRQRLSMIPGAHAHPMDASFSSLSSKGLPMSTNVNASALAGGARRTDGLGRPRMSVQAGFGGNMSMSTTTAPAPMPRGPGLTSRPSMSKLNTSVTAGDTSLRPAWR
ncbi:hypothetical protein CI109_101752 [Kwoniella shandongensis]|uniref:Uncharacterized protein n=1 Tax=Kwoniella shandongensis TaxID=1734106 RepID=A0A5M6CA73_9TREE|nr:uncharacterized protein CI109_001126 [Kwoniella shandongensis]KAA5530325.1 hypothetical protein CI109_001126 [Kwoniella shandongensis]